MLAQSIINTKIGYVKTSKRAQWGISKKRRHLKHKLTFKNQEQHKITKKKRSLK